MAITAAVVRYIKLGRNGSWERAALDGGELHFGFRDAPHDLLLTGDFDAIRRHYIDQGRGEAAATRDAREAVDFYKLGDACLWITFAREHLWWAFASPVVTWMAGDGSKHGERTRKVLGQWRNTDINGRPLKVSSLSTRLTKVAGYRRTICNVEAEEYLFRRINAMVEPIVEQGSAAREALLDITAEALKMLHQDDFETLVDIMFARSGWNRVSALGGVQKLVDLEIEQSITGERAAVQVKSSASQAVLDNYIRLTDAASQYDRIFFICHSPTPNLVPPEGRKDVQVWTNKELAAIALKTGLNDWILEKIAQS